MRIQYIVSCRYDTNDVNVRFMTLLEEHICKYDNIEMVDKAPDLAQPNTLFLNVLLIMFYFKLVFFICFF